MQEENISKLDNDKFLLQNIIKELQSEVDRYAQNKLIQTEIKDDNAGEVLIIKSLSSSKSH